MTTTLELIQRVASAKAHLNRNKARLIELDQRRGKAITNVEEWQVANQILQQAATAVEESAHAKLQGIVSRCLATVFDDPYEFKIDFGSKRSRSAARIYFTRDGNEIDPMEASGLGVVDVAAFALRVACVLMHNPQLRRTLILDEPFRFVSAENKPKVRMLLEEISEELGIQIIMVTHEPEFAGGNVIHL